MKIPPKNPHFFKPILPGFKDGLKIPVGFLKYLKGLKNEHAILRCAGKKWLVKVNGRRFETGWADFAQQHDLQLGDLLVFRHEGNMEFEVTMFDSRHCDREYSEYLQQQEEEAHNVEETSKNLEVEDTNNYASIPSEDQLYESSPSTSCHSRNTDDVIEIPNPSIKSSDEASSHEEAATDKPFGHSHFICTIKPYCLTYGYLYLPQQFANGLSNKKCDLIIRDERQGLWSLKLSSDGKNRIHIGDGWRKFIADNRLKEGDRVVFEVITDEETSIWKFHVVTNAETPTRKFEANATEKPEPNIMSSHKVVVDVEAAKDMPLSRPHFISTVKPHHISKCRMHVPKLFARENGLSNMKCTIAIRDEQRSWEFRLHSTSVGSTFIGGGWRKFCAANLLKKGDRIMFEIFAKGEKPILKFYDLRANASLQPEERKPNLDAERVSTQGLGVG